MSFFPPRFSNTLKASAVCALAVFCAASQAQRKRDTTMLPGSVKNFELPSFDENTGAKEWELFGDSAIYISDEQVDIDKLLLNLYEGEENPQLKAEIKSPVAHVNPDTKIVVSNAPIYVKGEGFDLSGKKWRWNGETKFIEIFSDLNIDYVSEAEGGPQKTNIKSVYGSLAHGGKDNIFRLKDSVVIEGDDLNVKCDAVELESERGGDIKSIKAEGSVKMLRDNRDARAQRAEIDPASGIAKLYGNPSITDIPSKAKLSGDVIALDRDAHKIESFSGGKNRAQTVLIDNSSGREDVIIINADDIEMVAEEGANVFNFKGNVEVVAPDYTANCDILTAFAKNDENAKPQVTSIKGEGSVKLVHSSGTATSKKLEAFPEKSEIWLTENASLKDPERGTVLDANAIVFMRDKDKGMAFSEVGNADSFVVLNIKETPELAGAPKGKKSESNAVVKSRKLDFSKSGEHMLFTFTTDVSIISDNANAVCQKMDVLAKSEKDGSAEIKKIIAYDGVKMVQDEYTATSEIATIFPKLKAKGEDKKSHKFVELGINPGKPGVRPSIILPPVGNLGLVDSEVAKKSESKPTVITSDKQWLTGTDSEDRYFFEGDVKVEGTDMNAVCKKIEVVMRSPDPNASREITHIIMTGDVKLSQGLKDATCGRADIHVLEEMAVLSDSPVVFNREDNTRATGYRMIYNKGRKGVSVEGDDSKTPSSIKDFVDPDYEGDASEKPSSRPTITLPPVKSKK